MNFHLNVSKISYELWVICFFLKNHNSSRVLMLLYLPSQILNKLFMLSYLFYIPNFSNFYFLHLFIVLLYVIMVSFLLAFFQMPLLSLLSLTFHSQAKNWILLAITKSVIIGTHVISWISLFIFLHLHPISFSYTVHSVCFCNLKLNF